MHYYHIPENTLTENVRIPLQLFNNSQAVFNRMAAEMAITIEAHNTSNTPTVFIVPVGPVGQYPIFVELVNSRKISLRNVWFFNMDEYLTDDMQYIDKDSPLSFRGFMQHRVYDLISPELQMPEEHRIFPDPLHPEKGDQLLEQLGGPDICFGGIGINGHVAFNEADPSLTPEQFAALPTRTLAISRETRTANAIGDLGGAIEAMPRYAVTIGMKQILSAKKIRLGVFRDWHRAVVRRAAFGDISADFPVTLLQKHPDAEIYVNDVAAREAY